MSRINVLPDEVLIEMFDFYLNMGRPYDKTEIEAWQSLVHVCRRWRSLVFRSPRRLNLRLFCKTETPTRDTLGIWPPLPLIIEGHLALVSGMDNIIAALGQSNRICQVTLRDLTLQSSEEVLAEMQVPFPELTDLQLSSYGGTPPIIPDSFLGGSAPRLRHFELSGTPFLGLSNLLLSATHLFWLRLVDIPHAGYISPEAMVALLSSLSNLKVLELGFRSPQSRPGWESPSLPPPKRSILPALSYFNFTGVTEYLEELTTRIDTPQLNEMNITFFNQIDFDCPRLAQFINRTPKLTAHDKATVLFDDSAASITLRHQTSESESGHLLIVILCSEPDWQLSSIEQICSTLPPLSMVENLYIDRAYWDLVWKNDAVENTLWFEFLLPFTAVKNLYLFRELVPGIALALQEVVGGRIMEVLPSLQNIFAEGFEPSGPLQENIGPFVAARQLSGHPIAISVWAEDPNMQSM